MTTDHGSAPLIKVKIETKINGVYQVMTTDHGSAPSIEVKIETKWCLSGHDHRSRQCPID